MSDERGKTLKALKTAIQMEISTSECYLRAIHQSSNVLSKKLLQSFDEEEQLHLNMIKEIYNSVRSNKVWPAAHPGLGRSKFLRAQLENTCEIIGLNFKAPVTEIEAIKIALNKEKKSTDFYKSLSQGATGSAERDFYDFLIMDEREHTLILLDWYNYLKDPASWFIQKEYPSLDAG